MATWFTADTHFGHENIIRYTGRPYRTIGQMNYDLIRRWNETVAPDDVIYHLGDFALGPRETYAGYCAQLAGHKILLLGNHDEDADFMREIGFEDVLKNVVVEPDGKRLWLNHYPIPRPDDFPGRRRPEPPGEYDLALCGHVHEKWLVRDGCVNVGVDGWKFRPVSLAQIMQSVAASHGDDC